MNMRLKIVYICKKQMVLLIALIAAIISSFIVGVDKEYLNYFDYKTLIGLFSMLTIITACRNIYLFRIIAHKIIGYFSTTRTSILALVYVTFIGSMIIANDMALITFLPLGYYVLNSTNQQKYMAFTFIMQNIAANLGGMLTPFGNPQNLYLYSYFHIDSMEFIKIMLGPFMVSITLITICCFFVKNTKLVLIDDFNHKLDYKKTIIYFFLFVFFIFIIFRLIPYLFGMSLILIILFFVDKKSYKEVDYALLITFVAFFIFAGNVSRIELVKDIIGKLINGNTLLTGIISCQIISNVPSAILLSKFTMNYQDLLIAVNIGGTGTIISSLASLITYKEYIKHNPSKQFSYIVQYSLFNFSFLIVLTIFVILMK